MKTIPNYHPPQDYRRPTKTQEKVYVPVNDYPEINFSMITNPLTSITTFHPLPPLLPPGTEPSISPATCRDAMSCRLMLLNSNPTIFFTPLMHSLTLSSLLKLACLLGPVATLSRKWRLNLAPRLRFVERAPSRKARVALMLPIPATRRKTCTV